MNTIRNKFFKNSGFLNFFKKSLRLTQNKFLSIISLFKSNLHLDDDFYQSIKEKLLLADIGFDISEDVVNILKKNKNNIIKIEDVQSQIKSYFLDILSKFDNCNVMQKYKPFIILFIGINGAGKTTSIAKLANYLISYFNKKMLLVAADTYKFSAIQHIKYLGKLMQIPVISSQIGANPISVILKAIKYAVVKDIDYVLIDTSGRFSNKTKFMLELQGIVNKIQSINSVYPNEIYLVLDINAGQNISFQVENFKKYIDISGFILTKLDGTAKGGIILKLVKKFNVPVKYITYGENLQDLEVFNSKYFVDCLIK